MPSFVNSSCLDGGRLGCVSGSQKLQFIPEFTVIYKYVCLYQAKINFLLIPQAKLTSAHLGKKNP